MCATGIGKKKFFKPGKKYYYSRQRSLNMQNVFQIKGDNYPDIGGDTNTKKINIWFQMVYGIPHGLFGGEKMIKIYLLGARSEDIFRSR